MLLEVQVAFKADSFLTSFSNPSKHISMEMFDTLADLLFVVVFHVYYSTDVSQLVVRVVLLKQMTAKSMQ